MVQKTSAKQQGPQFASTTPTTIANPLAQPQSYITAPGPRMQTIQAPMMSTIAQPIQQQFASTPQVM